MLNPSLIKLCGEASRDVFNKLVGEMGEDNASKCYFVTDSFKRICGVDVPGAMFTTSDNPLDIGWRLSIFIDKYANSDNEEWIFFYGKRDKTEGGVQLWLSSDSKIRMI